MSARAKRRNPQRPTAEETFLDGRDAFRRHALLVTIVHFLVLAGFFLAAKWTPQTESVVWFDGGLAGGPAGAEPEASEPESSPPEPPVPEPPPPPPPPPEPEPEPVPPPPVPDPAPSEIVVPQATPTPAPVTPKPTPRPTPTPTPKPKPTPSPTPKPTPKATPKPTPKATPKPGTPKASPAGSPKASPTAGKKAGEAAGKASTPGAGRTKAGVAAGGGGTASGPGTGTGHAGTGRGSGPPADFGWYHGRLRDRYMESWQQPTSIIRSSAVPVTKLKIRIARSGAILHSEIVGSSGNPLMDESVEAVARRVTSVEPLPTGLGGETYEVAIEFKLDQD